MLFSLIPLVVATVLVGSGVLFGRYMVIKSLSDQIYLNDHSYSLGEMVGEKKEDRIISEAYYDSDSSREEMDNYLWLASHVMTPFVGHGPKPGTHHNGVINDLQFRTSNRLELPKPGGVYRIFLVGGSTAFGSGAPSDDQTIGGYLQEILNAAKGDKGLPRFEVFTFAQSAWASTHERIIIENRIIEFMPDLVISLSGLNDVHWGRLGRNALWFRSYADEHYWRVMNDVYAFLGLQKMPDVTVVSDAAIPCDTVATRLERNVSLSSHALELIDSNYLFVLQPYRNLSRKDLNKRELNPVGSGDYWSVCYSMIEKRFKALKRKNLSYLSLVGLFDERDKAEIYIDNYHFGSRGNELIAQAISEKVRELTACGVDQPCENERRSSHKLNR